MAAVPAIMAAGGVLSAIGAMNQAQAAESAAYYNAALNERAAGMASEQAMSEVAVQRRVVARAQGAAVAGYGASGVTTDTGSPLDVLASSASESKLDEETLRYRGRLKAMGFQSAAELDRQRAETAKQQGPLMAASYLLSAGGQAAAAHATINRPYYGSGE